MTFFGSGQVLLFLVLLYFFFLFNIKNLFPFFLHPACQSVFGSLFATKSNRSTSVLKTKS